MVPEVTISQEIAEKIRGNQFLVSEFFSQKVLGIHNTGDNITLDELPAHHSRLIRIMPWDGKKPVLAGTDLHFSGGGVEITEWNTLNGNIKGKIETDWNYPVQITAAFPDNHKEEGFFTKTAMLCVGQKEFVISKY